MIPAANSNRHGILVGLYKKYIYWARICRDHTAGIAPAVCQCGASSVLAMGKTFMGVARATGGVPVLASNTPSDFIFVGLSV